MKAKPRTFWIVESEYGWDVKRYVRSIHPSFEEASTLRTHLRVKNPHDKFEVFEVRETVASRKRGKK